MAALKTQSLHLRMIKKKEDRQFDPHLQEVTARLAGSCREVDVIAKLRDRERAVGGLRISRKPGAGAIVTGRVAWEDVEAVRSHDNVLSLKAATDLHLCLYHSVPAIHCDPESLFLSSRNGMESFPGLDGSGVVIGVVDVGCDFRHRNFRHGNMTRIHCLWDQSSPTGRPPAGFDYGREITAEEINQALRQGDAGAYQALGYAPPIAAHGTHVLDIAAGNGREDAHFGGKPNPLQPVEKCHPGVAPNATLVFVQLRSHPEGFLGNSRELLEAVEYVFEKADQLGMPAVVNLSLATSAGPHDGSTLVEQGFESLLEEKPGRALVVAAGNSRLQRGHTAGTVAPGRPVAIRWHTDSGSAQNAMEIWYSAPEGDAGLVARLRTPDGVTLPEALRLGEVWDLRAGEHAGAPRMGRVSHREKDPNNGDHQIALTLPHLEEKGFGSPAWEIELSREEGGELAFHAWIDQDDRGRAYFEDAVPSHTLSSIACSENVITVGAFDTAERESLRLAYEAAACGPTRSSSLFPEQLDKPEVSAPGVAVVAARAHGGVTVMSGTSMAAAHVTGLVALLFQLARRAGRGDLEIEETRALLAQGNLDGAEALRAIFRLEKKAA